MFDREAIERIAEAESICAARVAVEVGLRIPDPAADEADASPATNGVVALPGAYTLHDIEKHLPLRRRARGTMFTSSIEDFASYAATHMEIGAAVFVSSTNMRAVAVLNLGTPLSPGHADNRAELQAEMTAEYAALLAMATGTQRTQTQIAEFMEDWFPLLECYANHDSSARIETRHAIAAVRNITIEGLRKVGVTEESLSASKSTFESVRATSGEQPLPGLIVFRCTPYRGLSDRAFALRLSVITGDKAPQLTLRIAKLDEHKQEIGKELRELVRFAISATMPVLVGEYKPS